MTLVEKWRVVGVTTVLVVLGVLLRGQTAGHHAAAAPGSVDQSALTLQVLLDRARFSPGEIDGARGANTQRAIAAFAKARTLRATDVDALMRALGSESTPALVSYTITAGDVAGPFTQIPEDIMLQASLSGMDYQSPAEAIGERFHVDPALLERLNPGVTVTEGTTLQVPNVEGAPAIGGPASRITVSRSRSSVTAENRQGDVIFYAPVTSGSEHDPLPLGRWAVTGISKQPVFRYNPDLFWDADPAHTKATIQAGPNNPVGLVWIDITKPHYGLHGSPEPGTIGHTASHGCVRLTNWDAVTLASLVAKGTPVLFVP